MEAQAIALVHDCLTAYPDQAAAQHPLDEASLAAAQTEFEAYPKTVADPDTCVNGDIIFFGRQGGSERALDIFYGI